MTEYATKKKIRRTAIILVQTSEDHYIVPNLACFLDFFFQIYLHITFFYIFTTHCRKDAGLQDRCPVE